MTEGNILRHLTTFALPLLVGNFFQHLYNIVDTWVVGNFVSNEAFSAVGTVGSITNLMVGFFSGLAGGAGVIISQYYGAGRENRVKKTVHTALVMTFVLSLLFTLASILIIPLLLDIIRMPVEIRGEATTYLTIYFAGLAGLMFYNMGAGILRAVGDSHHPFQFLLISTLIHIVLDLLLVLVFGMGVEGVALATIVAQGVSALLVMITLLRYNGPIRMRWRELKIDGAELRRIVLLGLPAGLQTSLTSFSNIFIQSYINYFGADLMAGYTTYHKLDQILFLPMQSIGMAATTFVGQNLGSGNVKRAKKGISYALWLSFGITVLLTIPVVVFAPQIATFFNDKPEVIHYGTLLLRLMSPLYILVVFNQIYTCALRGAGNSKAPMLIMIFSFVIFRQVHLFITANFISNTLIPIVLAYPAGWLVSSVITSIYYHRVDLVKTRIVKDASPK